MQKEFSKRIVSLAVAVVLIFSIFTLRLVQWQVIQGEEMRNLADTTASDSYTITAARGEIVDRYGRPLATNRIGFNVVLNRSYLKSEDTNATIVRLIGILNASGEVWQDSTPMQTTYPYTFLTDEEGSTANSDAVQKLKETLELNVYATEQNVIDRMVERYNLQDVPQEMWRIVGGIRYEMEIREYGYSYPFTLATDVSIETVSTIKEHSMELTGVDIIEEAIRTYPNGTIMPHIIGIVGPIYREEYQDLRLLGYQMNDILGKSGIELAMESELRGTDGVMQVQRTRSGEIISQEVIEEPVPGNTVVLTIDKNVQLAAQQSLEEMIEIFRATPSGRNASSGAVVVLDVKTGEILAIATYPSYDLNYYTSNYSEYLNNPDNPLFNRATQGLYRPGSTFKVTIATAGMATGLIDANSTVYCGNVYTYWQNSTFRPSCLGTHRNINVVHALEESCNIFFYDVGRRLGLDEINETAALYGFGQPTGIEIPEQIGSLSTRGEDWQEGDIVQVAIGQMNTYATPLQLAVYASTAANNGDRYAAHIIQAVRSYDYADVVWETQPELLSSMGYDDYVFDTLETGMIAASLGHSGNYFQNYPITIATKTGSPQVTLNTTNCIMIAYGPTDNPDIAVAVIVENCSNSYLLGKVVTDIYDAYYESQSEGLTLQPANTLLP